VAESKGIGILVDRYHNWNVALYAIMASAFMGIVLLSWMWNLSPRRVEAIESPGLSCGKSKEDTKV